jgi:hypothetical protein
MNNLQVLLGNKTTQLISYCVEVDIVRLKLTAVIFTLFIFHCIKITSRLTLHKIGRGCYGRDRMVVGFTTTCAISTSHH